MSCPFDPTLDVLSLARALVGARLVIRGCGGLIAETEAYARDDPASHSFAGPNARNRSMFGPPGHAYLYRSYGIHICLNVVGRTGAAVLIRALLPSVGLERMRARRPTGALCSGPGRIGQALGLTLADDGHVFDGEDFQLLMPASAPRVLVGPRIGISRAKDRPWRFGMAGVQGLSRPFPEP